MNKLFLLAPLALLAGCAENIASLESRHFSNENATVSITYSAEIAMDNADDISKLEQVRILHERDFLTMGFIRTAKARPRPLICSVEVRGRGTLHHSVTCTRRDGARRIEFVDDHYLSTMLAFIFPDDFKKLVPEG
jgi:hypothetical protein